MVRRSYVRNAGCGQCPRPSLSREWRHDENSWLRRCRYRPEIWRLATGMGCECHRRELRGPQTEGSPATISVKFSTDVSGWPRYQMAQKHCGKFQLVE